jgi:hypothetical protein
MPRNRLFFTAPIVLAIVLVGVFFIRSRGDDNAKVETQPTRNCPPIARADAVATKPGTPISIDVLANDTDPDGDPLVFQIRKTVGGDAGVDDGGTPTDAGDDRVLFTPADPAPAQATIDYEAVDPSGALGESTVTVEINADGVLPVDVHSEEVPTDNGTTSDGCGTGRVSTTTTGDTTLTTESTNTTLSGQSNTATTVKKSTSTRGRTTTTKKPTATTTTQKPATTTTAKPATTTTAKPTTTTTQTTQPDPCGPPPQNTDSPEFEEWKQCERDRGGG